jgi:DnaK suppressor protein
VKRAAGPQNRLLDRLETVKARLRGWELPETGAQDVRVDRAGGNDGDVAAMVDRDLAFADRERLLAEVASLAAAIERLADGTYGECQTCGLPISDKRLAAIPEAEECIACAEAREIRRRHRGVLDEEDDETVTWCSVCHHEPAVEGFDLGEKCLQLGSQPELD